MGILCHLIEEISTLPLRLCINIVPSVCIIMVKKKTSGKV